MGGIQGQEWRPVTPLFPSSSMSALGFIRLRMAIWREAIWPPIGIQNHLLEEECWLYPLACTSSDRCVLHPCSALPCCPPPSCQPHTAMVANDDSIELPVDSILSKSVIANDINVVPASNFAWLTSKTATYMVPPSTTPVALAALTFSNQGLVGLNPAANAALKPGVVITFMYYVQGNVAGLPKSNNATVTITIAAPGDHAAHCCLVLHGTMECGTAWYCRQGYGTAAGSARGLALPGP